MSSDLQHNRNARLKPPGERMTRAERPRFFKTAAAVTMAALLCSASFIVASAPADAQSAAARRGQPQMASGHQRLSIGVGKSIAIELPRDARDVIVANPGIANAVVRSARRVFLIGVAVGQTNVFFIDGEGQQIAGYHVDVDRDLGALRQTLRTLLPNARIDVRAVNDSVVLHGEVATPLEATQAVDVVAKLVGDDKKVVNALTVRGRDQVHLRVSVSEIQRSALRQLGVSFNAFSTASNAVQGASGALTNGASNTLFGAQGSTGGFSSTVNSIVVGTQQGSNAFTGTLQAFEENGLIRSLAEPNLTAISGEQAKFLAGGEYPVPIGYDSQSRSSTIEFKPFGVGLAFTPIVLSEGRISLRVGVEVSEIDKTISVPISSTVTVNGLKVRRADTTVELPSGGSIVLAGLLNEQSRQTLSGMPGAANLPILGVLFRSREFQRGQTELIVIITPYIVRPVSPNQLARPDDNFQEASDPAGILIGRLNRIYGSAGGQPPRGRLNGPIGFIRD